MALPRNFILATSRQPVLDIIDSFLSSLFPNLLICVSDVSHGNYVAFLNFPYHLVTMLSTRFQTQQGSLLFSMCYRIRKCCGCILNTNFATSAVRLKGVILLYFYPVQCCRMSTSAVTMQKLRYTWTGQGHTKTTDTRPCALNAHPYGHFRLTNNLTYMEVRVLKEKLTQAQGEHHTSHIKSQLVFNLGMS